MLPRDCKRLAEVDFPIAEVSRHAAREKSIRHGHPSTLHLWWARRPLAACRAMLLALLLPDPCDPHCPAEFKTKARAALRGAGEGDEALRKAMLTFIADFADWDNSGKASYIQTGRALVKAAHGEEPPLVVDPFAGGGSIPLEALRLGCDAFASDLNPVAVLILKTLLEDIPRHGPELAEELRKAGAEVKAAAEKELAEFYPPDPDGARPIAYLWARTVRCESCNAEIPLMRSFWLSKKANRRRALRVKGAVKPGGEPEFEVFEPKGEKEVQKGTVANARATCIAAACGKTLPPDRVRSQLGKQRGGADVVFGANGQRKGGARLLAVCTLQEDRSGRDFRLPTTRDYKAVWKAHQALQQLQPLPNGLRPTPDEPINPHRPSPNARGMSAVTRYGIVTFGDLFSARQKVAMNALLTAIHRVECSPEAREFLGLALSRFADIFNAACRWENSKAQVRNLFTRQAVSMVWDFGEGDPLGSQAGDYETTLGTMVKVIQRTGIGGQSEIRSAPLQCDAAKHPLGDEAASCWFTDPPYYDAIPYADLSDFFFVWLKRAMPAGTFGGKSSQGATSLSPKTDECVWNSSYMVNGRPKDPAFFEEKISVAFREGRRLVTEDGVGGVVFAHQTTEGWEAMLTGLTTNKWTITASWPIATELPTRARAKENASLATSVHLVLRPREDAGDGDWSRVARELPVRVRAWMDRLEKEGIRGADLVFACIGPAMELYSRYDRVVDAQDRTIKLGGDPTATEPHERGYLAYVWEVVGRTALEKVLGAGAEGTALEEDARLTALFLWTLQSTVAGTNGNGHGKNGKAKKAAGAAAPEPAEAEEPDAADDATDDGDDDGDSAKGKKKPGLTLIHDVARRFAQPLGIHLEQWEGRIIETDKGVVRLLPVHERAPQLFGKEGAAKAAEAMQRRDRGVQLTLFPQENVFKPKPKKRGKKAAPDEGAGPAPVVATTLDKVHMAMLLQASGQAQALKALLQEETRRSPDFLRLANALAALYPRGTEERRLVEAMMHAMPK